MNQFESFATSDDNDDTSRQLQAKELRRSCRLRAAAANDSSEASSAGNRLRGNAKVNVASNNNNDNEISNASSHFLHSSDAAFTALVSSATECSNRIANVPVATATDDLDKNDPTRHTTVVPSVPSVTDAAAATSVASLLSPATTMNRARTTMKENGSPFNPFNDHNSHWSASTSTSKGPGRGGTLPVTNTNDFPQLDESELCSMDAQIQDEYRTLPIHQSTGSIMKRGRCGIKKDSQANRTPSKAKASASPHDTTSEEETGRQSRRRSTNGNECQHSSVASFEYEFPSPLLQEANEVKESVVLSRRPKEINVALSNTFDQLLNSSSPDMGLVFSRHMLRFHGQLLSDSMVASLIDTMTYGPKNGRTRFPDCHRMNVASDLVKQSLSTPTMLDKFLKNIGETYWTQCLDQMVAPYYIAAGDESRTSGDAIKRICQSVHAKMHCVTLFLTLLECHIDPCLQDSSSGQEKSILRSILNHRRGPKEALEKSVQALMTNWVTLGHFVFSTATGRESEGWSDVSSEDLCALRRNSLDFLSALGRVCNYMARFYGDFAHEDASAVARIVSQLILTAIQSSMLDPTPFLGGLPVDKYWIKVKLEVVLNFDQKLFPNLRPALANDLGVGFHYNIVHGRHRRVDEASETIRTDESPTPDVASMPTQSETSDSVVANKIGRKQAKDTPISLDDFDKKPAAVRPSLPSPKSTREKTDIVDGSLARLASLPDAKENHANTNSHVPSRSVDQSSLSLLPSPPVATNLSLVAIPRKASAPQDLPKPSLAPSSPAPALADSIFSHDPTPVNISTTASAMHLDFPHRIQRGYDSSDGDKACLHDVPRALYDVTHALQPNLEDIGETTRKTRQKRFSAKGQVAKRAKNIKPHSKVAKEGSSKAPKIPINQRPKAKFLSETAPNVPLEGGWPQGWLQRVYQRMSGASKGKIDRYWYTPVKGYQLRSTEEVKKFICALQLTGDNNEESAWKLFKQK